MSPRTLTKIPGTLVAVGVAAAMCMSVCAASSDVVRDDKGSSPRPPTHSGAVSPIVTNMAEAARSLLQRSDPGEATQSLQRAALQHLERLLQQLLQNRQTTKASAKPAKGRLHRGLRRQETGADSWAGRSGKGGGEAMQDEYATRGQPAQPAAVDSSRLREVEAWGFLPPDQRREVLQGLQETPPARYRKLTERYWRLLSESGMGR